MHTTTLLVFVMLCFSLSKSVKHEHLFKQQGLVAGVTSYGHLTFDIDLSAIDLELQKAESMANLFKEVVRDPKVDSKVHRVSRSIFLSLKRNIRQTQREWDNLRWSIETPMEPGSRNTRFIASSIIATIGAIGSIASVFSLGELLTLSSSVDAQSEGTTDFIIETLQNHEARLSVLEEQTLQINNTLKTIVKFVDNLETHIELDHLGVLALSYVQSLEFQVDRISNGINAALDGRTSPHFIDSM